MKEINSDKVRLLHIQEAVTYIETFLINKNKEHLYNDPLLRFAVERQLEIIGEAANHLSEKIKTEFSEVEWKRIVGFRIFSLTSTLVSTLNWFGISLIIKYHF